MLKPDTSSPLDDLARASEALRRAKEKLADATHAVETAQMVLDRAKTARDALHDEADRFRARVKELAAKLADE